MFQASLANHQGAHKCIQLGLTHSSPARSISAGNSSVRNLYVVDSESCEQSFEPDGPEYNRHMRFACRVTKAIIRLHIQNM